MTFFENELMKMFGRNEMLSDVRCVGNALFGRLTPDTIAKIEFKTSGVHGEYTGALIKIINPKIGEVDRQTLDFNDVFCRSKQKRAYIWDMGSDGQQWYNYKPDASDYKALNRAANQYLEMFAEPVQDMQMGM